LYVKEKGRITNKEYQSINNCSKATASRELADLAEKGLLQQHGTTGKGTYYILGLQRSQTAQKGLSKGSKR